MDFIRKILFKKSISRPKNVIVYEKCLHVWCINMQPLTWISTNDLNINQWPEYQPMTWISTNDLNIKHWPEYQPMTWISTNDLNINQWPEYQPIAWISSNDLNIKHWPEYQPMTWISTNDLNINQWPEYQALTWISSIDLNIKHWPGDSYSASGTYFVWPEREIKAMVLLTKIHLMCVCQCKTEDFSRLPSKRWNLVAVINILTQADPWNFSVKWWK